VQNIKDSRIVKIQISVAQLCNYILLTVLISLKKGIKKFKIEVSFFIAFFQHFQFIVAKKNSLTNCPHKRKLQFVPYDANLQKF
jgi:hypothetical protein